MTVQIQDILNALDRIAPFRLAEKWDNVGLLVGNPENAVTAVLVGLDPTVRLLDEAISQGANTVITHHPVIFHPLSSIKTANPTGIFLEKTLIHHINIIACHTNLDSARSGVSDALAEAFELIEVRPLQSYTDASFPGTGIGRIGAFPEDLLPGQFMQKVFQALNISGVQMAGQLPDKISRLALCGGSGSDLAELAFTSGADVYLSAEIKHSTARWAEECGFCIIDGTHFATEQPVVKHLAAQLQSAASTGNWGIPVRHTLTERHPFTLKQPFI